MKRKKVAIVGTGISGLSAAWLISKNQNVSLFEKNDYFGGHSNTKCIKTRLDNKSLRVDTGFIVFNHLNYPNLTSFFKNLNVSTCESDMSFSVSMQNGKLEYGGQSINSLFAQRFNLLNLNFWKMLFDIVKFYKRAFKDVKDYSKYTIDEYLSLNSYSSFFKYNHLYPMAASIWSAPIDSIKDFPFKNFVDFFNNHGLLNIFERPKWKTVENGSKTYVDKVLNRKNLLVYKSEGVLSVKRENKKIFLVTNKKEYIFDQLILACHSDQSLQILKKPTKQEIESLSKIRYQKNIVWLHSDEDFMPKNKKVWSSWNYIDYSSFGKKNLCVTYWMNKLQKLDTRENIFVSLNLPFEPKSNKIYKKITYTHPLYDYNTIEGQNGINKIQGQNNTWFCGAYLGNGFHEDGIRSGLFVGEKITGNKRPWKT